MKRKIRLREKAAFILFLVSMSAMDSDSRVVAVIIIITTLGILFYAGQAYRETRGKKRFRRWGGQNGTVHNSFIITEGNGEIKWKVSKSADSR